MVPAAVARRLPRQGMKHLLQEIHRRSMWQVLGLYLGTSWVVLQVVEMLVENTDLPQWVMPFTMVLLLIGLTIH